MNGEKALPLVREKYRRRISRFKAMCLGENKIIFIRTGKFLKPKEEAVMIRDFFRDTYPDLEFLLLVISSQEEFRVHWNIEGIKNFYLKEWHDSIGLANILRNLDPAFSNLLKKDITVSRVVSEDIVCEQCIHEHELKSSKL